MRVSDVSNIASVRMIVAYLCRSCGVTAHGAGGGAKRAVLCLTYPSPTRPTLKITSPAPPYILPPHNIASVPIFAVCVRASGCAKFICCCCWLLLWFVVVLQ